MSHFSQLKTKIRDIQALSAAAKQLGLTLQKDGVVRGYNGNRSKADYLIRLTGNYDVGFVKQADDSYALIADWYTGSVKSQIGEEGGLLLQHYALALAAAEAIKQNYQVSYTKLEDGTIRMTLTEPEFA